MFLSYVRRIFMNLVRPVRTLLLSPWKLFKGGGVGRPVFSLAAKVAFFVAVALMIGVVISFFCFIWRGDRTFWQAWFRTETMLLAVLVVAIPIVVYNLVKLFSQGEVSPFRDIDVAWNAGMRELERHGIDIAQVPLFLVLGTGDEESERQILEAAKAGGLAFDFEAIPQGTHPLHWYACHEAIYVACTSTGILSHLSKEATRIRESGWQSSGPHRAPQGNVSIQGTLPAGGGLPDSSPPAPRPAPPVAPSVSRNTPIDQTLAPGNAMPGTESAVAKTPDSSGLSGLLKLEKEKANREEARLEYLSQLIRESRAPVCPINGCLVLAPFHLVQMDGDDISAPLVREAIKRDVDTLADIFRLRFPVTFLVSGMQHEPGFMELTRRVGFEVARETRFGKGYSVKNPSLPERLEALGTHACGAFEAKIYELFQELGSLNKLTGNKRLYTLLCKIRGGFSDKISNLLPDALATDPEQETTKESLYVVGCYFAATGEAQNDQQAFLRSVFRKSREPQGELQWTREALARDQKCRSTGQWLMTANVFLVAILVLEVLCYNYWDKLFGY